MEEGEQHQGEREDGVETDQDTKTMDMLEVQEASMVDIQKGAVTG